MAKGDYQCVQPIKRKKRGSGADGKGPLTKQARIDITSDQLPTVASPSPVKHTRWPVDKIPTMAKKVLELSHNPNGVDTDTIENLFKQDLKWFDIHNTLAKRGMKVKFTILSALREILEAPHINPKIQPDIHGDEDGSKAIGVGSETVEDKAAGDESDSESAWLTYKASGGYQTGGGVLNLVEYQKTLQQMDKTSMPRAAIRAAEDEIRAGKIAQTPISNVSLANDILNFVRTFERYVGGKDVTGDIAKAKTRLCVTGLTTNDIRKTWFKILPILDAYSKDTSRQVQAAKDFASLLDQQAGIHRVAYRQAEEETVKRHRLHIREFERIKDRVRDEA
ncbi:hypothetical protein B0A49_08962 [Cryomyces minteri]|uniref:Uncharacterized protein n=1 Tax=Cryomyces minteri TaxID=331657 RepID=A0A4U0WJY3_9PEZI|nr:hypothetical protein B0A49_08962 [Cryomyces minteri]